MADDDKNTENLNQEKTDDAEDRVLTLGQIIQDQHDLEEDAAAVLGGSDSKCCTYNKGYIKRQALYACLTCVPEAKTDEKKRAGVCLACTYKCHDGHELIELYTKRNFRCDCGTSKILAIRCKLDPMKPEDNDLNSYNQNFSGVYCTCQRPYPDPEDIVEDEMIQCILCEDWYHFRHLETPVPDVNTFDEVICSACTKRHNFLQYYGEHTITAEDAASENAANESVVVDVDDSLKESTSNVDTKPNADEKLAEKGEEVENVADDTATCSTNNTNDEPLAREEEILNAELNQCIREIIEINKGILNDENKEKVADVQEDKEEQKAENQQEKRSVQEERNVQKETGVQEERIVAGTSTKITRKEMEEDNSDSPASKRRKFDEQASTSTSIICTKPKTIVKPLTNATFWRSNWRNSLCKCPDCLEIYKEFKVEFITDLEDTVLFYQNKGMAKLEDESEQDQVEDIPELRNLDHIGRIEAIMGYNKLKEKLTEFLRSFISDDRVITVADVDGFFSKMKESDKKDRNKQM